MRALASVAQRWWSRLAALPVLRQDALLYLCAGVFASGVLLKAISADYREWAAMAVVPYLAAAGLCELVVRHRARSDRSSSPAAAQIVSGGIPPGRAGTAGRVRGFVIVGLLALTVLLPLSFQLVWRAHAHVGEQAQVEVAVIERAGDRAAHGHDPYLARPTTVGISPSSDSRSIDSHSFFPYLPGMVPFGMTNALSGPAELTDARLTMSTFTLLVALLALLLARAPAARRWRVFQVLIVLPTGALPLVTGGDDLPVLSLMLLGLVLAGRRKPVVAGLVMGLAGTLKLTAWGLIVLLTLGVRERDGRRAPARYAAAVAVVALPVIGLGIGLGPHAFFENVIAFPLGLTAVHSPAASPLPGQDLVNLLPHWKNEITAILLAVGGGAVLFALKRWPPRTPAHVARFTALATLLAIVLAPATRFGYLIYPANLLFWSWLVSDGAGAAQPGSAGEAPDHRGAGGQEPQLASPTW